MIVGTAGHIDHGKSALLTALTGRPMDRLAEERRRGITIELNFAPLELGGGTIAGVVDVPGHEDYVRTMVAGASGMDLALLVVAADEGIMPQTLEHLLVLEQLGVRLGIPVVTKSDLVDREWLDLLALEVSERLARSPIRFEAPVRVSVRTGEGVEELRARIAECAHAIPPRPSGDLFRLPVDRCFSVAGVGTVVTGTAWSGRISLGDSVILLPGNSRGRVRSIETHGRPVPRSEPAARTAVGIAGVTREEARRGTVLVAEGQAWAPASALDVELSLAPAAPRALVHRSRIRVHLGTGETIGRVLTRAPIEPGGRGLARLALETPVVARGGDRMVMRSFSPVVTIGGGEVLDPLPPLRRVTWPEALGARLPAARLQALVDRRPKGVTTRELPVLLGLPPGPARALAQDAAGLRRVGDLWVTAAMIRDLGARSLDLVRRFHHQQSSERGIPLETLRRSLRGPREVVEAALAELVRSGRLRRSDGVVALAGFAPKTAGGEAEVEAVVRILEESGLTPPSVAELEHQTGKRDVAAILRFAAFGGRVEAVERDRYYAPGALEQFIRTLRDIGTGEEIVPSELRRKLGISRKYLIPLLEWADVKGVTERVEGVRKLKVGSGPSASSEPA